MNKNEISLWPSFTAASLMVIVPYLLPNFVHSFAITVKRAHRDAVIMRVKCSLDYIIVQRNLAQHYWL